MQNVTRHVEQYIVKDAENAIAMQELGQSYMYLGLSEFGELAEPLTKVRL